MTGATATQRFARRTWTAPDALELVGDQGGHAGAPTVILMHGGGQTRHSWAAAAARLAEAGYHVINFDARGHGESGWSPDAAYDLNTRLADLRAVSEGIAGPVALVGASMGGMTALSALAAGERPAALVLVDILPRPDPQGVARIHAFMTANPDGFETLDEAADAVAAYNPHRARAKNPEGLRKNLREGANGRFYWHWDPRILERDESKWQADQQRIIERLPTVDAVPLLLVRGLLSDIVNEDAIAEFRAIFPAMEIVNVTAGHMVAGDDNDVFIDGLLDFLGRAIPPHQPRTSP